jgi:hypothetical protein
MGAITVGVAQLGPIGRAENQSVVLKRLIAHLQEARARGCALVVSRAGADDVLPALGHGRSGLDRCVLRAADAGARDAAAVRRGGRLGLAFCSNKTTVFDFARHRRLEHYRLIVERAGATPPP